MTLIVTSSFQGMKGSYRLQAAAQRDHCKQGDMHSRRLCKRHEIVQPSNNLPHLKGKRLQRQLLTFGSVELAIAPQNAAVGGRITAIQRILVVKVYGLFQCCLCGE